MAAWWRLALLLAPGAGALSLAGHGPGGPSEAAGELVAQHVGQGVGNAAGCALVDTPIGERDLDRLRGVFPIGDFKQMLGYEFAKRSGGPKACQENISRSRWCSRTASQEPYFGPDSALFREVKPYLTEALEGTDLSSPLVVTIMDMDPGIAARLRNGADSRAVQAMNFMCGWERLGILRNRSAIFATSERLASEYRKLNPRARVLYHPVFSQAVSLISDKTGLGYKNRVWKLMVTQMIINLNRDLLLTDLDVYFVRDPVPMLQEAAQVEGLEFAAMADGCWLELNSGFLYYRSTKNTKRMLDVSLTTRKDNDGIGQCTDNDQYLLNCGFARAAVDGLQYKILPRSSFQFGSGAHIGGPNSCQGVSGGPLLTVPNIIKGRDWLGDGLPYILHTAGFSGSYHNTLDKLVALGAIDVDGATGRCLAGRRGNSHDAEEFVKTSSRGCYRGEGGIVHADCYGECRPEPLRSKQLRDSLGPHF